MALSGPQFRNSTEDAPRGWVVLTTSTVYRQAMIARYTTGPNQGFVDNVGASASMAIVGISDQNGGAQPAGHTLTMSPEVLALEIILPMTVGGSTVSVSTANRDAVLYGVDSNTVSLVAGDGIPVGMLMEVIDSTHVKAGIGQSFVARAIAAQAALDSASVAAASPFKVDELAAPAATSTTALLTATATANGAQTYLAAALVAGGLTALATYPRNVTFTGGGTTASCPTSAAITGTDIDGNALTENVSLTAGSGTGVKAFKTITQIVFTGGTATNGTEAIGIGSKFGFTQTIKVRANLPHVLDEIYDSSGSSGAFVDPSTATIVNATTSPPHGTWTPANAPNGTHNYAITYEHT
jgi:hypothetical protein